MSAVAESYEVQRANRRFIEQSFRTPMVGGGRARSLVGNTKALPVSG